MSASLEQELFKADQFGCAFTVYDPWDEQGVLIDPLPERAAWAARQLVEVPYLGPLSLVLNFYLPHPPSHYGPRGNVFAGAPKYHAVLPSCHDLMVPLLEGFRGILWKRPQQLSVVAVEKHYGTPARVRVRLSVRV